MAFSSGKEDPLGPARSRKSEPFSSEHLFSFLRDPLPTIPTAIPSQSEESPGLNDSRASLQRRFTTNTYISPIGQHRKQAEQPPLPDLSSIFQPRFSASEKKKAEYESLRQKQMQRQNQLEQLNLESRREEMELRRLSQELGYNNGAGHISEPTTPPDSHVGGFSSAVSRPSRFSTSNLISPTANHNRRVQQPETELSSPPNERARAYNALTAGAPTYSLPHSTDQSDEGEGDEVMNFSHRSAAALNRNSMPVTRPDLGGRKGMSEATNQSLGHVNTHAFLFGDDFEKPNTAERSMSSSNHYLNMTEDFNDDQFPVLPRGGSMQFTGGSAGDDGYDHQALRKQRAVSRRSLPVQTGHVMQHFGESPPKNGSQPGTPGQVTPIKSNTNRHSLGSRLGLATEASNDSPTKGPVNLQGNAQPKLQSSHSTSSVPTISSPAARPSQSNPTAEQRLHQHNVSLGRIPPGPVGSNRQSREIHSSHGDGQVGGVSSLESMLETSPSSSSLSGGAPVFGASQPSATLSESSPGATFTSSGLNNYGTDSLYGGYGMGAQSSGVSTQNSRPALSNIMSNLNLSGGPSQWSPSAYGPQLPNYNNLNPLLRSQSRQGGDSQARIMQQRRNPNGDDAARFYNLPLENLQGEIISLCKDQHGCRFLQKKLEESKPEQTQMIFEETKDHMVDLMVDPFGNYLCQKLLEQTSTAQHAVLIHNAAPQMVRIALNQHGTRALQKMIEYVVQPDQTTDVVNALQGHVVAMIQDLNGNHVIQKCLNHIKANNLHFIIDAVAESCYAVGTHRHGCCVIQRCIDHATGAQKATLVRSITDEALRLVEDPFGNYVLQYIFDQRVDAFTAPLCHRFLGRLYALSSQKFSSNVIEKCIRIADNQSKHLMIEELLSNPDFEKLVDHSYGNYVVQTAWEYADVRDEERLAERIRPMLPRVRSKPYGRRFQARMGDRDRRLGVSTGAMTPAELSSPESINFGSGSGSAHLSTPSHQGPMSNLQSPTGGYGSGLSNPLASPPGYGYGTQAYGSGPQAYAPPSDFGRPGSHSNRFQNTAAAPSFPDLSQMSQQFTPFPGYANLQNYGGSSYY